MSRQRNLHPIERADLKFARKVGINQNSKLGRWTSRLAELGDQPPLIVLTLGVAGLGIIRRDERLLRTGLRMLAAHSLSTMAKLLVKDLVDRTRPGEKGYCLEPGDSRDGRLRSMPSGHSAGAVAVAGAIAPDYPRADLPVALASAAIAGAQPASRNHYLSDVLVGAVFGIGVAALAGLLVPPQDAVEQRR